MLVVTACFYKVTQKHVGDKTTNYLNNPETIMPKRRYLFKLLIRSVKYKVQGFRPLQIKQRSLQEKQPLPSTFDHQEIEQLWRKDRLQVR